MITINEYFCTTVNLENYTDINPRELGWEPDIMSRMLFGPISKPFCLIHYVVSGKGVLETKYDRYDISAGQAFIIRANERVNYYPDKEDPWKYIWVGFSGRTSEVLDIAPEVVDFEHPELFEALLKYPELHGMKNEYLIGIINLIICDICRELDNVRRENNRFVLRAVRFVQKNYMRDISAEAVADEVNLSRRYLSALFKAEMGLTLKEYITSVRMEHAKEFLSKGYSVAQTARLCGYNDQFNFSKMFKKFFGKSPSEHRISL